MSLAGKLTQAYFNLAYNPLYDFTTGRLNSYHKLQRNCISKLQFRDNDKVLCVGLGTGNEIRHVLERNRNVDIVGVDYSSSALRRAYQKSLRLGREIKLFLMDARHLEFESESFDKVLCLHVMDFLDDYWETTSEILRVLKDGGQFVITYPSDSEGVKLGLNLFRDTFRHHINSGKHRVRAFFNSLIQMLAGTVYLPLILRPKRKPCSHFELEVMIAGLTTDGFRIENDTVYQDFVVYGRKQNEKISSASRGQIFSDIVRRRGMAEVLRLSGPIGERVHRYSEGTADGRD